MPRAPAGHKLLLLVLLLMAGLMLACCASASAAAATRRPPPPPPHSPALRQLLQISSGDEDHDGHHHHHHSRLQRSTASVNDDDDVHLREGGRWQRPSAPLSTDDTQVAAILGRHCPSPATGGCPAPCPPRSGNSTTQCLHYLQESHKEEVCERPADPGRRRTQLRGLRLRHCCEHEAGGALPPGEDILRDGPQCRRAIDDLLALDELARRVSCGFDQVLFRYDCGQTYSIAHTCQDCKEAYRRWVCSSLVPHYSRTGRRVLPCLGVCQDVEQQCPYLLPGDWTNITLPSGATAHPTPQYAGEPTFFCLDPNIPETGEQRRRSLRGSEDCCYTHCSSPGRGVAGGCLEVCEHCPGRPPPPANVASAASTSGRTPQQVLLCCWTVVVLLGASQTVSDLLLQCLLVILCAMRVAVDARTKTKWKPCS